MTYPDLTRISLTLVLLLGSGLALNEWVNRANQSGYGHYTWGFVVVGVFSTLVIATILVPLQWVLWVLACFATIGTPMVVGALIRHERREKAEKAEAERKRKELEAQILELHGANQTTPAGE